MASMPKSFSSVRIIAGGSAEPPMTVRLRLVNFSFCCCA